MRRIGIDVGGTNTDAVLLEDGRVVHAVKTPTTADVTGGIVAALGLLGRHPDVARRAIDGVVIGTTHFVNAVVQRRGLAKVAAIRIGLPTGASLPPFCDWPADLAALVEGQVFMLEGGHEYDGREIVPFDAAGMRGAARQIRDSGLRSVAIAAAFSPLDPTHEERARDILREECPDVAITLSRDLGRIGLLERENAALLNAALAALAKTTIAGFRAAIAASGIAAPLYLTQNDGTVMSAETAMALPVMSFASGATNSMRGAAFLSGVGDAMVIDVGGTSTDVGELRRFFPREANSVVTIGEVRTLFRMPDLLSIGLGGGSIVREIGSAGCQPADAGSMPAVRSGSAGCQPADAGTMPAVRSGSAGCQPADAGSMPAVRSGSAGCQPADAGTMPAVRSGSAGCQPADAGRMPAVRSGSAGCQPADAGSMPAVRSGSAGCQPADAGSMPAVRSGSAGCQPADAGTIPAVRSGSAGCQPADAGSMPAVRSGSAGCQSADAGTMPAVRSGSAGCHPAGGQDVGGPDITVGPESVGYRLTEEAVVFGGDTLTATDAAVAAGIVAIGDAAKASAVPHDLALAVLAEAREKIEDAIDRMKTEAGEVRLIAVGGGAFLVPDRLAGVAEVIRVAHGDCANAVGAAIAQISGETDQVYRDMGREAAIAAAEEQARERAVAAGADPASLVTVDVEDMPLAYLPGNALRVRVRVAGDLHSTRRSSRR